MKKRRIRRNLQRKMEQLKLEPLKDNNNFGNHTDLNLEKNVVEDFLHFFCLLFFGLIDLICSMVKIILRVESKSNYVQFDYDINSTLRRSRYSLFSHFCWRRLLLFLLLLPLLFLPLCCIMLGFYIIDKIEECKNMIPEVISNKIEMKHFILGDFSTWRPDDMLAGHGKKNNLSPGDHIYTWRRGHTYAHHGIYVGDKMVIHLTRGPGNILLSSSRSHPSDNPSGQIRGDQSTYDQVDLSYLDSFLSGGDLYLFKYGVSITFFLAKTRGGTCTLAPSDPPEDVVRRAKYLLEKGFGVYNLSQNNCEDFAIYCKTGRIVDDSNCFRRSIGRSGQVGSMLSAIVVSISSLLRLSTASITWLAFVGYAMYCMFRLVSDVGVRHNVRRVEVEELVAEPERFGGVSFRRPLLDVIKPYLVPMIYIILGWLCEILWADVIILYAMFM